MKKNPTSIISLLNLPSLVTLLGLLFSLAALGAVYAGEPCLGMVLLFFTIPCDRLDGALARKLNAVSDFGAEMDNLSDSITFGVVPAIFLYLVTHHALMIPFSILLLLACVLRLARYSYVGTIEKDHKKYFVGLPTPYSAATFVLIWPFIRETDGLLRIGLLAAAALALSLLMMSTLPIRKGGLVERVALYSVMPLAVVYNLYCFFA